MKNHINSYTYELSDGRNVMSPVELTYAMNEDCTINLDSIKPEDAAKISIIGDPQIFALLSLIAEAGAWEERNPENAPSRSKTRADFFRHYCLLSSSGGIYIKDGRYVCVQEFLKTASLPELQHAIRNLATQAAMAQIELARLHNKEN